MLELVGNWKEQQEAAAPPSPAAVGSGAEVTRQYSLTSHPQRRDLYEIAVLREQAGRGASAAIHATWQIGTRIKLDHPVNQFPLHDDVRHAVLIAGGIGITPIKAMANALKARGKSFELHYSARTAADMAYRDQLTTELAGQLQLYCTSEPAQKRLVLSAVMKSSPPDSVFYICGPARFIAAAQLAASEPGIPADHVRFESFE